VPKAIHSAQKELRVIRTSQKKKYVNCLVFIMFVCRFSGVNLTRHYTGPTCHMLNDNSFLSEAKATVPGASSKLGE